MSVFGFDPCRIGAGEAFARELSSQLAAHGWRSVLCFLKEPQGEVRRFLEAPNVQIEVIEDSWRSDWRATGRLMSVLRLHRPRILHLYFTGFLSTYPWAAKLLSVERIYFTDQNSRPEGFVPRRAPWWKRVALRGINRPLTAVISVSRYGYEAFTALDLLPKDRFCIIYNSVNLERARSGATQADEFRRKHGIAADAIVITQVSWLIPEKGLEDLLQAAQEVVREEPRAHFVVAGEGAQKRDLEAQAGALGISSRVTFTGMVSDPLAEGIYAASDIVCQMSRWEEVFGFTNIEAMACSKPVVGTLVGGIPEIIEDEITGYLVSRRDPRAMASRILKLARDPELRRRMGEAGREVCLTKFNLKKNVGQLIALYVQEAARYGLSEEARIPQQSNPDR